ncbi:Nitrogen permease regulator 3 [Golovinomyces cichoracearum]|uniref:Nitrogen permease regulator 3 n=1 Tax=Golovinomyces cichoracearum TaxID=62708 RepID=A0A420IQL1_9PEZI|nr:Nitrogen permease regulator 3 [Golovinomyces cichoracearum]
MSSGLVAIALTIRSRDGPRFVFHYPAQPSSGVSQEDLLYGTDLDFTKIDTDPEDSEESDFDDELLYSFNRIDVNQDDNGDKDINPVNFIRDKGLDEHYDTQSGIHVVPWERLFEFSTTDLESLLTPSRTYHRKKFEITLDSLCFLSHPIHVRKDGTWTKKNPQHEKKEKKSEFTFEATQSNNPFNRNQMESNISEDYDEGGMTMFNAVFILDVPRHDLKQKAEEMYEQVAKKFNWALMRAQANSCYVWNESELILTMKEKAREDRRPMSWLWREILLKSTLACAMRDIHNSISRNKIATVHLGPDFDISLQIPIPSFLISLPTSRERAMLGLVVTTAIPLADEDGDYEQPQLNKNFALLLLEDETKLISELQADNNELSAALVECIRLCKPTLSFAQIARMNSTEVSSLLTLASYMVVYRRAIVIPPLHSRNVYIVSPNCDNRKLLKASAVWKDTFPFAPSLVSFLATLSATPRLYKTLAPSRDHQPIYMKMLEWLVRGGWVTQLRTFSWIQVWPEIQYEVDYKLRAEAIEKQKIDEKKSHDSANIESSDDSDSDRNLSVHSAPLTTEEAAERARLERLEAKRIEQAAEEIATFTKLPVPLATMKPSLNNSPHLEAFPAPYIIRDPRKMSYTESLYVSAIGKRFTEPRAKDYWPRLIKFFNGAEALEGICLHENMKRKEIWDILLNYQEYLLVCRYW